MRAAAITREPQDLSLRRGVVRIKAGPQQHLFAVKRPAFDEDAIAMLPPDLVRQMVGDRELQEVSGNSFMPEDRPRIFNRGANIEVLRLPDCKSG